MTSTACRNTTSLQSRLGLIEPGGEELESSNGSNGTVRGAEEPALEAVIGANEGDDYFYTAKWQVIEDRYGGAVKSQYVWSEQYIDALVLRDRDTGGSSDLDERLYVQHDANYNVTALIDTGGDVVERYLTDPYGGKTIKTWDWDTPANALLGDYGWLHYFQGARLDTKTAQYDFRNRILSVSLGRPLQADPLGYPDGMNRYEWEGSNPVTLLDPMGLAIVYGPGTTRPNFNPPPERPWWNPPPGTFHFPPALGPDGLPVTPLLIELDPREFEYPRFNPFQVDLDHSRRR